MVKTTDIRSFDYGSQVNQLLEDVLSLDSDGVQTIQIDYDIINATEFNRIKRAVAKNAVCDICNSGSQVTLQACQSCNVTCDTCQACNVTCNIKLHA